MHDKRVVAHLLIDGRAFTMTWVDDRFRRQRIELVLDREDERGKRTAGQVSATDSAVEERVAGEQIGTDAEADRTPGVTGRVQDFDVEIVPSQHLAIVELLLADDVGLVVGDAGQIEDRLELLAIIRMDGRLATEGSLQRGHTADMVGMTMRQQDLIAAQAALLEERERLRMLQAGIDDEHVVRVAATNHVAVLIEHRIDDDGELDEVAQRLGHDAEITWARR